jgi:hypothetical protein
MLFALGIVAREACVQLRPFGQVGEIALRNSRVQRENSRTTRSASDEGYLLRSLLP